MIDMATFAVYVHFWLDVSILTKKHRSVTNM